MVDFLGQFPQPKSVDCRRSPRLQRLHEAQPRMDSKPSNPRTRDHGAVGKADVIGVQPHRRRHQETLDNPTKLTGNKFSKRPARGPRGRFRSTNNLLHLMARR